MYSPLVALPLQLACQLIIPGNDIHQGPVINTFTPDQGMILPGGYTPYPKLGVAWKYYQNPLTWNAARKLCMADGASLAIVDSFEKVNLMMDIKDKSQGVWTGLHKMFDSAEWIDVKTGEPPKFIPWRPDAASNSGLCIANRHDTLGVSAWGCGNLVPVMCEIPIFKSDRNEVRISPVIANSTSP